MSENQDNLFIRRGISFWRMDETPDSWTCFIHGSVNRPDGWQSQTDWLGSPLTRREVITCPRLMFGTKVDAIRFADAVTQRQDFSLLISRSKRSHGISPIHLVARDGNSE